MKKSFLKLLILSGENFYSNPEKDVYVIKYDGIYYCIDGTGKDGTITEKTDMMESIKFASKIAMSK